MSVSAYPTALGYALLGLVHQQPRSGYDLCQLFAKTPMGTYSSSSGAIYPALKQLERRGLVTGQTEKPNSLKPRRTYRPTAAGLAVLKTWLAGPVTREQVLRDTDVLMLRFAFMEGLVSRRTTMRFLAGLIREVEAFLDELRGHHRKVRQHGSLHGQLALESGMGAYRNLARWARRAVKCLETESVT